MSGAESRMPRDREGARPRVGRLPWAIRRGGPWIGLSGAIVIGLGVALPEPWVVCLGTAPLMLGFFLADVARARQGGLTPITIFALSAAANALANAIGLHAADGPERDQYFLYASEKHLYLAALLALAGAVLPVLGFRAASGRGPLVAVRALLPPLRGYVPDRHLVLLGSTVSALALVIRIWSPLPQLGTLLSMLYLAPPLATFVLARAGTARGVPGALPAALAIAIVDGARAVMFDYLRGDMLVPFAAFALGSLLGGRSLRPLRSGYFIPLYIFTFGFVAYFGTFGELRARTGVGVQRVIQLREAIGAQMEQPEERQTILSRLTSFNQISQVGRIVEEDGFQGGATLDYLAYAFIPRVFWPDKPEIAKGAWFALRIGQANLTRDGRIMNSVNMTIQGELYLNFGWTGVVVGCLLFGVVMAVLWSRTGFWKRPRDVLGTAFGFYLLWLGAFLGADLQVLVTLAALYLLFLVAGAALLAMNGLSPESRAPHAPDGAGVRPSIEQRGGVSRAI